jgi:hypothetical protein
MPPPFRLFPEDYPWWTFADYGQLLDQVRRFGAQTALEFGPGGSTLALVEGGAVVDACEDDPVYLARHRERLGAHPVMLFLYTHAEPLVIPPTDGLLYDLAFVDGPRDTLLRPVEIEYAAARSRVVVCHDATSRPVREALDTLGLAGWAIEIIPFKRPRGDENALGVAVAAC